jgi:predicted amidohydrolase YtcJ
MTAPLARPRQRRSGATAAAAGFALATIALATIALATPTGVLPAQEHADLLLRHGTVFTADPQGSMASAVAIRDGRIVAVGGDEIAGRFRADRVVDLRGRLTTPGFIDTHIHIAGDPRWHVDLSHFESIEDIQRALREKAHELGPGKWITGDGWAEGLVREHRALHRQDLDTAAPDNPTVLARAGGHSVVANSLALRLAGITRATPDPQGGVIERDPGGEPNGIIRERLDLVGRLVPTAPPRDLEASFVAKLKGLLRLGVTSIIVAGIEPQDYAEWERVCHAYQSQLPRVTAQIYPGLRKGGASAAEALRRLDAFGKKTGDGDQWLRVGAVKLWLDGGFAGPAAWTLQPYANQPTYFGIQNIDSTDLYTLSSAAHRRGWQLGYHAIGDAAIKLGADVIAKVVGETPRWNHRHYLNHFTVTPPPATMRKMAAADIHISQQPNFTWSPTLESRYVENLEGARREHNNPLRTPLSYGIFMAFGSDNHPIGPMPGLYGAVTRRGKSGHVYAADEQLSMPEALVAYTRNGAYFTFEEGLKGTIEPGKLADIIVLSENLLEVDPSRILDTKVDLTILNGTVVYERGETEVRP